MSSHSQDLSHIVEAALLDASEVGLPKPKRRKIGVACDICRLRKSKCDGSRPCAPCLRRKTGGGACTYLDGKSVQDYTTTQSGPYAEVLSRLTVRIELCKRVQMDEHHLLNLCRPMAPTSYSMFDSYSSLWIRAMRKLITSRRLPLGSRPVRNTSTWPEVAIPPNATSSATPESQVIRSAKTTMRQPSPSPVESDPPGDNDAMGNVDNWGLKAGLLGASSSASFMRSISKVADGTSTPIHDQVAQRISSSHASSRNLYRKRTRIADTSAVEYVLPARKIADRLLDIHWNLSQVIFPWLDRLRFMKWYHNLWTNHVGQQDPYVDEQIYYCMLNTIFAISYKLDPSVPPEGQENLSNAHFERAQKLLCFNLLEIGHINLVQALLLMGQYLQSTNMPQQCFQCIGLAIWIAQDIGLHVPETCLATESQHDREMALRSWHGCLLMDRITSMTFGRPTRISQEVARQSPLPAALDDEYFDSDGVGSGSQPKDQPSKMFFFVAYCELHLILGDILLTFYAPRTPPGLKSPGLQVHDHIGGKQNVDKLLQFDKMLNAWRSGLPPYLQIEGGFQDPTEALIYRRQAIILSARYLHIRLLLYRPFLSKPTEASDAISIEDGSLAHSVTSYGLIACVNAAQQILELISTHMKSDDSPELLPPWWHVISYVYAAGTTVIAAHLFPSVVERISVSALTTSIRQGFHILQQYQGSRKSAQRCKSELDVLYNKVVSITSRRESPNGTLITPNMTVPFENIDFAFPAAFIHDANASELIDGSDLLWLNTAPFDPENNFWL